MLEIDVEPVVLDLADRAVAEFLVKHAVAHREAADLWHFLAAQWHARAFDQQRLAAGAAHLRLVPGGAPTGRRGGPAWRCNARAESRAHPQPELGDDLDMVGRQFVDKTRARRTLPLAVDASVGGKRHQGAVPRP